MSDASNDARQEIAQELFDALNAASPEQRRRALELLGFSGPSPQTIGLPAAEAVGSAGEIGIIVGVGADAAYTPPQLEDEAIARVATELPAFGTRVAKAAKILGKDTLAQVLAGLITGKVLMMIEPAREASVTNITHIENHTNVTYVLDGVPTATPPAGADPARVADAPAPARVSWRALLGCVRNAQGGLEPEAAARAAVEAYRRSGTRPRYGWTMVGLPHEDARRPDTWGPRSPADVIWEGMQ